LPRDVWVTACGVAGYVYYVSAVGLAGPIAG